MKPEYTVVWNNLGDQPYLSVERDTPRAPVQPEKRGAGSRDMQGLVLAALRSATEPISAYALSQITGFGVKTCRVIMLRAVVNSKAVKAGRRRDGPANYYQQTWRAV